MAKTSAPGVTSPRPTPPWLTNALLTVTVLLFGICVVLALGVFVVLRRPVRLQDLSTSQRLKLVEQAGQIVPKVYQPFPLSGRPLFYHMKPNTAYENVMRSSFTTNDLGFRTIPTSPKPAGVKRIVLVGDSWTYGQGVHRNEAFGSRLEEMLNRSGGKWQVYALAMPGWNTYNEMAALRTFYSQLKPDAVVFCPTSNDIDDAYDVWDGRIVNSGFSSGAVFLNSFEYQTRWIGVFQTIQAEVDALERRGVPSLVYFLAEWRKLAPYYAALSQFRAPYIVIPTEYLQRELRLAPEVDSGEHATAEGHKLIAEYLHNALVQQHIVSGLDLLPTRHTTEFPSGTIDSATVAEEFKRGMSGYRQDLVQLNNGFVSRMGIFSIPVTPNARTIAVLLDLVDDPGLYPLTAEVGLQSPERVSVTKVFDHFVAGPIEIDLDKPGSLKDFPLVEVRIATDRVVTTTDALIPISMKRPKFVVR